jgi:outer membrane protein TolC
MIVRRGFVAMGLGMTNVLLLGACALHQQSMKTVSEAVQQSHDQRPATAQAYGSLPPASQPELTEKRKSSRAPEPPATLEALLLAGLEQNREIAAAEQTAHAKANRVAQATALADPTLMTKTLPTPTMLADGNQYFTLGVEQELPVPGKLDHRGRMALQELRMAIQDLRRVQQRTITDIKKAYFELFVIDRTTALTLENKEVLRGLLEVAQGQFAAGKREQQDVLRAQVELSGLDGELIELGQRRTGALAMLNALLNRPGDTPVEPPGAYDLRRVEPRIEDLLSKAAGFNPELAVLRERILRDEQAVELAKLAYWPDFRLGFEWMNMEPRQAWKPPPDPNTGMRPAFDRMSEEGTDMWAITVGLNLPVWFEKIEAGIREARHTLSASREEYAAAKNTLDYRVREALSRVRSQRDLADLFASTVIPLARQTYEVSLVGYATGTADFQFLIDNWQKWLAFRVQYYRALGELERSIADLEQAVGVSAIEASSPSLSDE